MMACSSIDNPAGIEPRQSWFWLCWILQPVSHWIVSWSKHRLWLVATFILNPIQDRKVTKIFMQFLGKSPWLMAMFRHGFLLETCQNPSFPLGPLHPPRWRRSRAGAAEPVICLAWPSWEVWWLWWVWWLGADMGLSENGVYSQWNSHLIGIMISKTIGFRGTLFSDKPIYQWPF